MPDDLLDRIGCGQDVLAIDVDAETFTKGRAGALSGVMRRNRHESVPGGHRLQQEAGQADDNLTEFLNAKRRWR